MLTDEYINNLKFQFEFNTRQVGLLIGVVTYCRDNLKEENHSDSIKELNEILDILYDYQKRRIFK